MALHHSWRRIYGAMPVGDAPTQSSVRGPQRLFVLSSVLRGPERTAAARQTWHASEPNEPHWR